MFHNIPPLLIRFWEGESKNYMEKKQEYMVEKYWSNDPEVQELDEIARKYDKAVELGEVLFEDQREQTI